MTLNYVTITETFTDGSGNPALGSATFTPSAVVYASGVPQVTPATPIQASIVSGALRSPTGGALTLLATDNSGLTVEGQTGFWFWTVQVQIGSAFSSFSFFLPHTPSTVELYSLANTAAGGGGGSFNSPMTTEGDMIVENATPAAARLAGPTTGGTYLLTSTPSGGIAQIPAWAAGITFGGYTAPAVVALTFGVTISVNAALGNTFAVTLTSSSGGFANPTNPVDGQVIRFRISQDVTGGRTVTWGGAYDFGSTGGVANNPPPLTAVASKTDVFSFEYNAALAKWCYLSAVIPQGF